MEFVFLSGDFYRDYSQCKEIEKKSERPYTLVCARINGQSFAIPLRSNINHKYVLWTNEAERCGLDFSKAVILIKSSYIDRTQTPHIRSNEFEALRGKEYIIKQKMQQYINTYKKAKRRMDVPRNNQLCQYSTLQYFEQYL